MSSKFMGIIAFACLTFACVMQIAQGQICTPATCPPGPVVASFQYSNCTGDVTYQYFDLEWGKCINSTTTSIKYAYEDSRLTFTQYFNDGDCGVGRSTDDYSYSETSIYFRSCIFGGTRDARGMRSELFGSSEFDPLGMISTRDSASLSAMYLPNVNASFDAPQNPPTSVDFNIPLFSAVQEPCYGPNNCSWNGEEPLFTVTGYTNDTCSEAVSSMLTANVTDGTCYRVSDDLGAPLYSYTCEGPHSIGLRIALGFCDRPLQGVVYHYVCGDGVTQSYSCTPRPSPPPPPTSSASQLVLSTMIFAVLASILALFAL